MPLFNCDPHVAQDRLLGGRLGMICFRSNKPTEHQLAAAPPSVLTIYSNYLQGLFYIQSDQIASIPKLRASASPKMAYCILLTPNPSDHSVAPSALSFAK